MICLDNIIFSLQRHGGVSVLWGELIQKLLQTQSDTLFLETKNTHSNEICKSLHIPIEKKIVYNRSPIILERFIDPKLGIKNKYVFHSSHYRISRDKAAVNITTVHDFTYEYFFSGIQRKLHAWQKYKALRNSDHIICISENTKKDLLHFLPEIEEKKISIIYNGVSDDYYPLTRPSKLQFEDYILFVGGRQSYKNFNYAVLCAKEIGYKLLIVGGSLSPNEIYFLDKELGPEKYKNIIHPSNETLNQIYNSAACLIYPSLYEGFGIPVIEAQKAGCPVIAMNSSSIPEIIGDKTLLLSSSSVREFKEKFNYIKLNRDSVIFRGLRNSERFSWEKMTNEYLNIYNRFLL